MWRSEVLNGLNGLNSRLDTAKDTISELEGGYKEVSQSATLKIEMICEIQSTDMDARMKRLFLSTLRTSKWERSNIY